MNKLGTAFNKKFRLVTEDGQRAEIEIPVQLEEETPTIAADREQGMYNYYYHETAADHPWLFGLKWTSPTETWHIEGEGGFPSLTAWRDFPWEERRTVIQ